MAGNDLLFDAVLTPNCSLGRRGFAILMAAVCVVSLIAGLGFFLVGAWPVVCFFGLDVALIYLAFRINYRRASMREILRLTRDELMVESVNGRGEKKTWRFTPAWLQVGVEEPTRAGAGLVLRSHGKKLEIGRFLTLDERRDLSGALRQALIRARAACTPCAPQTS